MNKIFAALAAACAIALALISCEKDDVNLSPLSSLTIANAVVGTSELKLGSNTQPTFFNSAGQYGLIAGNNQLYIWPAEDSASPVYNQSINTRNGGIYTLFLAGQYPGTVEPILVEEDLPLHTDSTTGVRFIHLAAGAPNVSIKLAGGAKHEFTDLEFKEKSWFLMYPAKGENAEYIFEIFDNTSGELVTTYTLFTPRFKNVTLAITGNATIGYSVVQVNHF